MAARFEYLVCLTSALALSIGTVQANENADGDRFDPGLEEIIIQSEKFGRTLLETTTSISVISGDELERRSIDDLYDLVLRTANISQSFGEKGFSIRGIDQRLGAGDGLLVNVIVDGASLPNNQSTFFGPYSAWDIGQIEVLRGPQGTTQGRNAIGGAIIINSADPELGVAGAKARASYGELNTWQAAAAVNIPIDETFALRFSGDWRESDGWVDNPTRGEAYDARKSVLGRAKAYWKPSDKFEARYTLSFTDSTGGEDLIDAALFPGERVNLSGGPAREGSEHLINTLQLDIAPTDTLTITTLSTFYDHSYGRLEDFDATPAFFGDLDRTQEDNSFTQEARARYDAGGRLRLLVGAFYGAFDSSIDDAFTVPVAFLGIDADTLAFIGVSPTESISQIRSFETQERNWALFGEAEYDVTDKLTLVAGLRYDNETRDFVAFTTTTSATVLPFPLPADEEVITEARFDALLPKAAIRYAMTDDIVFGLSAQRAYRAGGTDVSLVSGTVNEFDPEFTWSYEASVRASLLRDQLTVAANVFYTDWKDQIVSRTSEFGIANGVPLDTVADNAGQSRLFGGELEVNYEVSDALSLFGALGLTNTKFVEFETPTSELSGNEFPLSPRVSFSVGADYRHSSGFRATGDISFTGETFSVETNDLSQVITTPITDGDGTVVGEFQSCSLTPCNDPNTLTPRYTIVNLKLGYEAENWSVYAFARNLFDENYFTQLNAIGGGFGGPLQQGRTGEPRVVGVEFNARFGI